MAVRVRDRARARVRARARARVRVNPNPNLCVWARLPVRVIDEVRVIGLYSSSLCAL